MYEIYLEPDILAHHGILGQKWGVRRYQNEDGSLTDAGRKRYAKGKTRGINESEYEAYKKRVMSGMTDQQLKDAYTRKIAEQNYEKVYFTAKGNRQKNAVIKAVTDIAGEALKEKTKPIAKYAVEQMFRKALGPEKANAIFGKSASSAVSDAEAKEIKKAVGEAFKDFNKVASQEINKQNAKQEKRNKKKNRNQSSTNNNGHQDPKPGLKN